MTTNRFVLHLSQLTGWLLFLLAVPSTPANESPGQKYVGKARIPGFGTVTLPAGEWYVEFRRPSPVPNPAHQPDYLGLRKVSETVERLAFRRYDPAIVPDQLVHLVDGIIERLGEGAPIEELGKERLVRKPGEAWTDGTSWPLAFEPPMSSITPKTDDIAFWFISREPRRPLNWICHAHLYARGGSVFVIIHASPSVLIPEDLQEADWVAEAPAALPAGK